MSAKLRRPAVMLAVIILFFSSTLVSIKMVSSDDIARRIDLFTQKMPYGGKGANQSCDAFQPQELVQFYAFVTYNEYPVANKLVAFQVNNPANTFQNLTMVGVSFTNQSGIAEFSFRMPWPSENAEQIIFGKWFAIATVDIMEEVIVDTLTFQVGWIIRVTSIETLNADLGPQVEYQREEAIVFNLTIENIALTPKSATIMVDAYDMASYPIIHTEMNNLVFQPGRDFLYVTSQIPEAAAIGKATVSATAYTAAPEIGGVPYSPPASTTFTIILLPLKQFYLTVRTDPFRIVHISGEGWYDESTNVPLTAPEYVSAITGARYKFSYWDVDGIPKPGNPLIVTMDANHTATAHYILQYYLTVTSPYGTTGGEGWYDSGTTAYATLNTGIFDHGNQTRRVFISWLGEASGTSYARSDPILMDEPRTAVASWQTQYRLTVRTDPSGITAIAQDGWHNHGENVTLSAPSVSGYDFEYWDVDGFSRGSGVSNITVYMDSPHVATAHYSAPVGAWYVPEWFYWILLGLLGLAVLLLIAWLYYRRRKKKAEEAFYRGWTAWYYCHDLRGRTRKA